MSRTYRSWSAVSADRVEESREKSANLRDKKKTMRVEPFPLVIKANLLGDKTSIWYR